MIEMYHKLAIYSLAIILLASSALVITSGTASASVTPENTTFSDWNGFLTIYPDGSLSDPAAPVVHSGYDYTLMANITGTITVSYGGAHVNGNGYTVTNEIGIPPIIISQADSVVISNFTVYSWYSAGINIISSSHDAIVNNTIYAMVNGVFVYSPYNYVQGNTINVVLTKPGYSGASTAIMVKASGTSVTDNIITMNQTGYGIVMDTGMSSAVNNSIQIMGHRSAGIVSTGASNQITGNTIAGNVTDSYGINLQSGTQNSFIEGNTVNVPGLRNIGIQVLDGLNTIEGNSISTNGSYTYGIVISSSGTGHNGIMQNSIGVTGLSSVAIYDNSQNSNISCNNVNATGYSVRGITITGTGLVSLNTITVVGDFSYGISALVSDVVTNSIMANGNYTTALYVSPGSYGIFSGNLMESTGHNAYGVQLNGEKQILDNNVITAGNDGGTAILENGLIHSTITNNSIVNSTTGLSSTSYSSYDNTYAGNYFYNDTVAFLVLGTSSNLFYHNSFINYVSYEITGYTGNATWDNGYPSGGNYWYAYEGTDEYSGPFQNITGSDGIGDSPFQVAQNNIDHYPLMSPWMRPMVTFTQTGLPGQMPWSVWFNGVELQSTDDSMRFYLSLPVYTSYGFDIHAVPGYTQSLTSGNVQYVGSNVVVNVAFTPIPEPSYNVVFTQTGLPGGTSWSVQLNGTLISSTGTTITFDPLNGTYSYTITGVSGYHTESYSGTVVVNGSDVTKNIVFTQVIYSVNFHTSGLPSGLKWYVNLSNGQSYSSTSSIIAFDLPNGTYSYTVDKVGEYNSTPSSGSITVSGASPNSVQITFSANTTIPPPAIPATNLWAYIIGIIIGGAVVGVSATIIYYVRKK